MRWFRLAAGLLLVLAATPSPGARLALVIGNDSYAHIAQLKNARADARAIAQALQAAGFKTIVQLDLTRSQMNSAVRRFKAGLHGQDEVVFFYAGHGVQLGSTNFLLPIDIEDNRQQNVADEGIELQRVLDDLVESNPRFSLAIIDACRNNPFKTSGRNITARGLMPTLPASGQMVIYSAGPGQVALDRLGEDDRSSNGVFTRVLLDEMSKLGVNVRDVAKRVQDRVAALAKTAKHEQLPAVYMQYTGEFFFQRGEAVAKLADGPRAVGQASTNKNEHVSGTTFRDCDGCPEMVVIPDGDFDALWLRPISVRSFAIGRTEVTQGQWKSIMGSNPSVFNTCGDDCPVENVNWDDAKAFISRLNLKVSGRLGEPYRLPSNAEWEYACREGARHRFCGDDDAAAIAWYAGNSAQMTHPVAMKAPNEFGIHDMSGNVREWVEDCNAAREDGFPDNRVAASTLVCARRHVRGGSWFNQADDLRTILQDRNDQSLRSSELGFRVARTLP